jgi:general stress protein CsbA
MDSEKGYFDKLTVAQYVGVVLVIVLLERPMWCLVR